MRLLGWLTLITCLSACGEKRRCEFDRNCLGGEICVAGLCEPVGEQTGGGGGMTGGGGGTTGGGSTGGGTPTGGGAATGGGGGMVCGTCPTGTECLSGTCTPAALRLVATRPAQFIGLTPQLLTGQIVREDGGAPTNVELPSLSQVSLTSGVGNLVTVPAFATGTSGTTFSFQVYASAQGLSGNTSVDMSLPTDAGVVNGSVSLDVDSLPSLVKVELVAHNPVGNRGMQWIVPSVPLEGSTVTVSTPRRDDSVVLRVSSPSLFSVPKPRLFAGSPEVEATPVASCPVACDAGACECYVLDLWRVPFNQVAGAVPLRAAGFNSQGVGFDGGIGLDAGSPGIALTRVRWLARPDPQGPALRATPAIDTNGNLFFGSMLTSTAGALFSLTPNGGTATGWGSGISVGSVTSVALEPNAGLVYFTANTSTGAVLTARTRGGVAPPLGTSAAAQCSSAASAQRAFTALALGDFSTPGVLSAITSFGAAGGQSFGFCTWDPSRADSFQPKETNDIGPSGPDDSTGVSNLFLHRSGSTNYLTYAAHFTGTDAGVFVVRRDPTANASEFQGVVKVVFGDAADNGVIPANFVDVGTTSETAFSGGAGAQGIRRNPFAATTSTSPLLSSGPITSKAVTDSAEVVWAWGNNDLHRIQSDGGVTAVFSSAGQFPRTIGSPVLSARITSDGGLTPDQLFAVSSGGTLAVVPRSNFSAAWQSQLPVSFVSASPAFDCNRLASPDAGAETGILYVVSGNGDVLSIIVDSPRLDRTAKWPKFQKDQFNSGNTSLNLDDGCR